MQIFMHEHPNLSVKITALKHFTFRGQVFLIEFFCLEEKYFTRLEIVVSASYFSISVVLRTEISCFYQLNKLNPFKEDKDPAKNKILVTKERHWNFLVFLKNLGIEQCHVNECDLFLPAVTRFSLHRITLLRWQHWCSAQVQRSHFMSEYKLL